MDRLAVMLDRLAAVLRPMRSVTVAFSGGVDSTLVLKVAHDLLGDRVLALTAASRTMPAWDREMALEMARIIGARHLVVESDELAIPGYAVNPANRCYLCKSNLFEICREKATELGSDEIVDGVNRDDLDDRRPGIQAAAEKGVRHPLLEAALGKAEVRELSRWLGLATWDRPASPCLSSRFPYGTVITPEKLAQVERGEKLLRNLGFKVVRVRYHGDVARIELGPDELLRIFEPELRQLVNAEFRKIGFRFTAIDLRGFRSGSLNEAIPGTTQR